MFDGDGLWWHKIMFETQKAYSVLWAARCDIKFQNRTEYRALIASRQSELRFKVPMEIDWIKRKLDDFDPFPNDST